MCLAFLATTVGEDGTKREVFSWLQSAASPVYATKCYTLDLQTTQRYTNPL